MRKYNNLSLPARQTGLILLLFFFLAYGISSFTIAKGKKDNGKNNKPRMSKTTLNPSSSIMDINNATMWVTDAGFHDWVVASSWNGAFPKGTAAGAIFAEGLLWGGQVQDGQSPLIRVNGNDYGSGTVNLIRLFRVRPDYETADLTDDAANFNSEGLGQVTSAQIDELRGQYKTDWNEWPAKEGAPYKDVNNNGEYDPNVDIPGIPGASQTIFIMYDDKNSVSLYSSAPIGLQVSETYWAYSYTGALGNVIYKKVDMVYKGTAKSASNSRIDSLYLVQWADPDVGTSTDDYAGCDTALNLGYAYNSSPSDGIYTAIGMAPPAVGYDFLQGVSQYTGNPSDSAIFNLKWRKGYKYVNPKPMSSFIYFPASGAWSDPPYSYLGTLQYYNLMRGRLPVPAYPSGEFFPENVADVTPYGTYLLDGDPVAGTGKLDGTQDLAGDRRIMCINGPINVKLGDTLEVVTALIYGMGSDNLSSVSALKTNDATAQIVYDQLFKLPSLLPPNVSVTTSSNKVVLNWGYNYSTLNQIETFSDQGYNFEGYDVYQLRTSSSTISDPANSVKLATFDLVDGITNILDSTVTADGVILPVVVENGKDKGIQRYMEFTTDAFSQQPLRNGQEYYYAVVAYAYNPAPLLPFHSLKSPVVIKKVTPQKPFAVNYNSKTGDDVKTIEHKGTANASIQVNVVDPAKTTGHQYQVSFHNEVYSLGQDGNWTDVTAASKKMGKVKDLTGSYITGTAAWNETKKGVFEIHYMVDVESSNYDYCDGVELQLPSNITIESIIPPVSNNDGSVINYTFDAATNTIFFGDSSRSANGLFAGGEDIVILSRTPNVPIVTNYHMYDDNFGATYVDSANGFPFGKLVDVAGSTTIDKVENQIVTQKQWDVTDLTTGNKVLKNQTIIKGEDIYAPTLYYANTGVYGPGGSSGSKYSNVGVPANAIFDGIQISIEGSYSAPTSYNDVTLNGKSLTESGGIEFYNSNYDITNFIYFGYADGTSAASLPAYVTFPAGQTGGTSSINALQQDYELRWTGVLGDTTINGVTIQITKSGGQLVTLYGASGYSLADHPLNPNPGTDAPFLIRVPFEVWNVDNNQQVNVLFWDRSGDPTVTGGKSWNTDNREYLWCVNNKYDPTTPLDPSSQTVSDNATWNWVIYLSTFTTGDVLKFIYANPLQMGQDTFTFNAPAGKDSTMDLARADVNKINVFPNPYYGYQPRETSRDNKYITFSHLPTNATIRIFDLSGVLVKTIRKTDPTQFTTWNLQNDSGYPVASGIYIAYIDLPDLGSTKILKIAIIQEQQILKVY